jgi:hypothetical protein
MVFTIRPADATVSYAAETRTGKILCRKPARSAHFGLFLPKAHAEHRHFGLGIATTISGNLVNSEAFGSH